MAGHSQFKNIMHRKGRQDAQKSKLFGKLAREITVAAKLGQPDPAMNARLRAAIIAAAPGEHVEGLDRARDQEGDRQRGRELRRDPLRGLWPGRRRRDRRGADRQPQPRRLRHPLLLHQVRRQSRRNRLGRPSCSIAPASSNTTPRSPPTTPCWMRRSRPAPTTSSPARTATKSMPRRKPFARSPRRWRRNSAKPARRR